MTLIRAFTVPEGMAVARVPWSGASVICPAAGIAQPPSGQLSLATSLETSVVPPFDDAAPLPGTSS